MNQIGLSPRFSLSYYSLSVLWIHNPNEGRYYFFKKCKNKFINYVLSYVECRKTDVYFYF